MKKAHANNHQNFIDWMKAVGMLLIVAGHVIGDPYSAFNQIAQPAYTKQLGVAFFVFIVGWGLSNVRQPSFYTVYSRLFAIYFWGILFALFFTCLFYLSKSQLQLSNYLPFMVGINVVFNNFPANPTTWYIGTYIHILLLWFFFLRHHPVSKLTIALALVIENGIRIPLLMSDQNFIAYMLVPNWLTVFVLGCYLHQQADRPSMKKAMIIAMAWLLVAVTWTYVMGYLSFGKGLPTRSIDLAQPWASVLQSSLISLVYLLSTWLFFQFARCLPASRLVRFLARNTLINFIIHLPIIFAFHPTWYAWLDNFQPIERRISLIFLVYISCAVVSEILHRLFPYQRLKQPLWQLLLPLFRMLHLVNDKVPAKHISTPMTKG